MPAAPKVEQQLPRRVFYSLKPVNQDNLAGRIIELHAILEAANGHRQVTTRMAVPPDFPVPPPKLPELLSKDAADESSSELHRIFYGLAKKWRAATGGYSVTTRRYAHPSYQAILVLKDDVVPLILKELQERPDWWFEALKVLTKQNPVKPNSTFAEAVDAWITWGKQCKRIA